MVPDAKSGELEEVALDLGFENGGRLPVLFLWIEGVRDKRGIEFWFKICGGGGGGARGGGRVVMVTPGRDRGEDNQRVGEGGRKAFAGKDPFSAVPPL